MRIAVILIAAMFITSCATTDYFLADGHRAAGTVTLVCNYDMFSACPDEPSASQKLAAAGACIQWGYTGRSALRKRKGHSPSGRLFGEA